MPPRNRSADTYQHFLALDNDLSIIPVLNKVDLPSAHPEEIRKQVSELLGVDPSTILACSAKTGEGVAPILERVITDVPPPSGSESSRLKHWFLIQNLMHSGEQSLMYELLMER